MNERRITNVVARRVWDSRALPTVEVEIKTAGGATGRAIAPAGASRGRREVTDRRDGSNILNGQDVTCVIESINTEVRTALLGVDASDQRALDVLLDELDPSPQRIRLGGNATVATSLAAWRAGAAALGLPPWKVLGGTTSAMPRPEVQIIGGGAHASQRLDIQDFMVIPMSAKTFGHALLDVASVYHVVGAILEERGLRRGLADEGGYWPEVVGNAACFDLIVEGIERSGLTPGTDVALSIDVAASEFENNGRYVLAADNRSYDRDGWLEVLSGWIHRYPIVAVEDPVDELDEDGMIAFTREFGERVLVIGDDYLVTRADLVQRAATVGAGAAVLVKVNQVGTVSAAADAVTAARSHGWQCVVSARSGETEDTSVADLAVGWGAELIKIGALARGERTAKWNELLRIAKDLGDPPLHPMAQHRP